VLIAHRHNSRKPCNRPQRRGGHKYHPFKNASRRANCGPKHLSRGIIINELLPNPKGPDGTDEWIELYNSNNSDVDLSDWQLQDQEGTITTYTIPQSTKFQLMDF